MVEKLSSKIIIFICGSLKAMLLLLILSNLTPNWQFTMTETDSGDKFEYDKNLQADAGALLSLFDNMPSIPVYIKDEPIIKSGTNTERGVAYTDCEGNENPSIFVKKDFYQKTNRKQLTNILKHELTHAWLCRQRLMSGHDSRFREKFKQVGGFGN